MMNAQDPIRVLVIDDSLVVRSVLSDIFRADPATELVGALSPGLTWSAG